MQSRTETLTAPDGATLELATVTFQGREFTAAGSHVSGDYLTCYMADKSPEHVGARGDVTTWDGKVIGRYEVTSRWHTPRSFVSSHMLQCVVTLPDGRKYTGRGAGSGMFWRGRRIASQRKGD